LFFPDERADEFAPLVRAHWESYAEDRSVSQPRVGAAIRN
jgi:hypothetical protein